MKICFLLFFIPNSVLANHESIIPDYQCLDYKYQNLARGKGMMGPPYQEIFQYLLVSEPGWLHFVFSCPLDPSQSQEVAEYQNQLHLNWSVCGLEIADQPWTAISMPVVELTKTLIISFFQNLKQLSFFVNLE